MIRFLCSESSTHRRVGIGKTTIETIERLALETGLSLWGAIGEGIQRQLLAGRTVVALKAFRDLIQDGRAMLAGTPRRTTG